MNQFEIFMSHLAKPAKRAIQQAQLKSFEDVSRLSKAEFSNLHGIGKHALNTVQQYLDEHHLNFKEDGKVINE